jgi:serine/threonine protein kinase
MEKAEEGNLYSLLKKLGKFD